MGLGMPGLSPASIYSLAGPAWLPSLLPGLQDGWLWIAWFLGAVRPWASLSTGEESETAVLLLQPVASRAPPWEGPWASARVSVVPVPSPSFPESPATGLGPCLIQSEWSRGPHWLG